MKTSPMIEEARYYSKELLRISEHRQAILNKMVTLAKPLPEYEILRSIPGNSDTTATSIIGELGDIHRFQSDNQINSFIGIYDSGNYLVQEHITKRGILMLEIFFLCVYITLLLLVIPILVITQISMKNEKDNRKRLQPSPLRLPQYIASSGQCITS